MVGLTARIYAIVIKVVIPAMTSVLAVVLFSFSLNHFSNIFFLLFFVYRLVRTSFGL